MGTARDDDLKREIDTHLELEAEEQAADGLSADDARHAALRAFGNVLRVRKDARGAWGAPWSGLWDRLLVDGTSAVRSLKAAPAVPLAAILTTALAIGVNLAMLGLVDRALLSPPPHVVEPDRVFTVSFETTRPSGETGLTGTTSFPAFAAMRAAAPATMAAALTPSGTSVIVGGERLAATATAVTSSYFDMLGVRAIRGRTLLPGDERPPAGAQVAVLSHALWHRAFHGDEQIIGRQLRLGDLDLDIVGVMPRSFSGHSAAQTDLWVPLPTAVREHPAWNTSPTLAFASIVVRLAPGQTPSSAASQLGAAAGARAVLRPIIGADVAPAPHQIAMWLSAVSLVVLFAGLANGATLFLVRSGRRRREHSIKVSLGATRSRLASQLVMEGGIIAAAAAGAALILGYWLDEVVRRLLFPSLIESVGLTRRVLIAAAAGGVCMLLVAVAPAILQLGAGVESRDGVAGRQTARRSSLGKDLLIVQTTLAVLLLTAAGMLGQRYFSTVDEGFARLDDVVVAEFERGPRSSTPLDQDDLLAAAVERVQNLPGVAAATTFFVLPFHNVAVPPIDIPGRGEPRIDGELPFLIESTPELLDILRVEIIEGRRFTAGDDTSAPPVAIVSETMARAVWPGATVLGKCLRIGIDPSWDPRTASGPPTPPASASCREIVGVARDWLPLVAPASPRRVAHYYVPFAQKIVFPPAMAMPRASGLLIQKAAAVEPSVDAIRRAIAGGRDDVPFLEVRPYAALAGPRLAEWLAGMKLLLMFGGLALATAAVGIHAAFAHSVAQRRQEIAIRLAVGASRGQVLLMVLREGALVAARGTISGVVVATLAGWVARARLVGLESPGPVLIILTGLVVLAAAIIATWVPALRASRGDPSVQLRD